MVDWYVLFITIYVNIQRIIAPNLTANQVIIVVCTTQQTNRHSTNSILFFAYRQFLNRHHQGVSLFGSRGNIEANRMFPNPKYNIATLSRPIPPPA